MFKSIKRKDIIFWTVTIILFVLLFFNYLTNCFHVVKMDWFNNWQADSNALMLGRMYAIEHFGWLYDFGLLQDSSETANGLFDPTTISTYKSQVGLSGSFWGLLHLIFNSVTFCKQVCVFLFCITAFVILKWIYKEFGTFSAIGAYFVLFFSKWVVVSARNLYWTPFLFLLPMIVTLFILKKEEESGQISYKWWLSLIFLTVFIKSCCGFEMISLVLINSVLPMFYYAFKNKWEIKKLFLRFFFVGLTGTLAFLLAIALHIVQLYFYFDNSWTDAIKLLQQDIARRTAAVSAAYEMPAVFLESLKATKGEVLKLYFSKFDHLLFKGRMDDLLIIFSISISILISAFSALKIKFEELRRFYSLLIMTFISLLGPISWYVLASPHSYIHTHINYILWSFPALILMFAEMFYGINLLYNLYVKPKFIKG